jgi:hypothetical protein
VPARAGRDAAGTSRETGPSCWGRVRHETAPDAQPRFDKDEQQRSQLRV